VVPPRTVVRVRPITSMEPNWRIAWARLRATESTAFSAAAPLPRRKGRPSMSKRRSSAAWTSTRCGCPSFMTTILSPSSFETASSCGKSLARAAATGWVVACMATLPPVLSSIPTV
jgi:hypothetical protein